MEVILVNEEKESSTGAERAKHQTPRSPVGKYWLFHMDGTTQENEKRS